MRFASQSGYLFNPVDKSNFSISEKITQSSHRVKNVFFPTYGASYAVGNTCGDIDARKNVSDFNHFKILYVETGVASCAKHSTVLKVDF